MSTTTILAQTPSPTGIGVDPPVSASFSEVLSSMQWGCIVLGILMIVFALGFIAWQRSIDDDRPLGALMLAGGVAFAVVPTALRFLVGSDTSEPEPVTSSAEATSTPIPSLPSEPAPPATPVNWTPVIYLGIALAALVVLIVIALLVVWTRHRILDRRAAAAALAADFAAAKAVYSQVADAYAEYLADPYAIFTRPLLDDVTEPRTAAFIDAFAGAGALDTDTCPAAADRVRAFGDASRAALSAWNTADRHARAVGMGVLTDDDKRTVRRIHSALELALDDTAAAGERESAIEAVRRLSNGLITVPDRVYTTAKTAIETVTRKQLTS